MLNSPFAYKMARNALFKLDAETAHTVTMKKLRLMAKMGMSKALNPGVADAPVDAMGITFKNPVGLAAGLDKNGECIAAFSDVGFGFVEIGTVTPRAQPGNPKPRMFRLPEHQAIINRLGFNNHGVDALCEQVKQARRTTTLGINIGKNFDTPNENAADDYLHCLAKVYPLADYVTVNISSPNTKNLRELQFGESLEQLLGALQQKRLELADQHGHRVPMTVKIAPDMDAELLPQLAETLVKFGIDGVIATNTTNSREAVAGHKFAGETGGLSGAPLTDKSTEVISALRAAVGSELAIIGVGGILSGDDAAAKIRAGANLVQIYTGFIYQGPPLIKDSVTQITALG